MKLFKSLAVYSATLMALSGGVHSEETTTFTYTNYVTPDCIKQLASSALQGNPESLSTGIPIAFVYGNQETPETSVVTKTSTIDYTVSTNTVSESTATTCMGKKCSPQSVLVTVPYEYTTTATIVYTTAVPFGSSETPVTEKASANSASSSDGPSTLYEYDTETDNDVSKKYKTQTGKTTIETDNSVFKKYMKHTAKTTTETLFQATSTPSTTYVDETVIQSVTKTIKDPLVTETVVKERKTITINTNDYTTSVVIGSDSHSDPRQNKTIQHSKVHSNSTALRKNSTSTIDLRVSPSSSFSSLETKGAKFSNSTHSKYVYSSKALGISDLAASAHSSSAQAASSVPTHGADSSSSSASSTAPESSSSSSSIKAKGAKASHSSSNGYSGDLFEAVSTDSPPSVFKRDELPLAIPNGVDNDGNPIGTNKFYANLFLDNQTDTIWSNPYEMVWKKSDYYGLGVQHTNASARVFGTGNSNNEDVPSYYSNPVGDSELIFSADALTSSSNKIRVSNMESMSVSVSLAATLDDSDNYIELPIVQGMGFVTGIYHGTLVPILSSLVGVDTLSKVSADNLSKKTLKYRATMFGGVSWLIYATLPDSTDFGFTVKDSYHIEGSTSVDGLIIQIAVAPEDSSLEVFYDKAAGMYVTDAKVEGSVSDGSDAEYKFAYTTSGTSSSGSPIVFLFPHHVESLSSTTKDTSTGISLDSTTKGTMKAYLTDTISMSETLETSIQFLPWVQNMKGSLSYSSDQLKLIASSANDELDVDINATVASMDSNYFSGKVIDKYAYILLVASEILKDDDVTESTLKDIKEAFEIFLNNKQTYPLFYDTKFKGVTSTASQNGDTGADYGSGYYNDHHFHYGYFVHAAAIVGYIDSKKGGTWASDNKDWVNSLIRDVANPSEDDSYFPVSRMFDWFSGHSWAAGLFASGDGKNEESSSEDYNFAYGMKLWGKVIGDNSMESRGDLMLAVMSRALNKYFYYKSDNTVEPSKYIPNKVSGIFFENKVAYTTYFGSPDKNPEYVHGIHMLPITPASSLIRIPSYVKEEWKDQISTFISDVDSGWTGILRLNQALYDASTSYDFFSSDSWKSDYLDGGQSRTWSLAFSGGIANAS